MIASTIFRAPRGLLACLGTAWGLSACSGLHGDSFKPYAPEVVQGNVVSREQRQYLRPGLTRAQVRDVLGTPLLTSLFHADRWDYAFSIRRQGVEPQEFHLTVCFQGGVLSRVEGDELPSEVEFVQRLSRPGAPVRTAPLEASAEQLRQYPHNLPPPPATTPSAPLPANYPPLESTSR